MSNIKSIVKEDSSKPPGTKFVSPKKSIKSGLQRVLLMSLKKKLLGELFITLQLFKTENHQCRQFLMQ
jgi:hypothetical protein